jgi:hypothetical protein
MEEDLKHLKLLSIFHYVVGGISALFSCMFLMHLFMGLTMILMPETFTDGGGEAPPKFIGYFFAFMGGAAFVLGIVFSCFIVYSGRLLQTQRKRMFSFVMACIECIFMPFGTVLGVFTIIVLSKESVKKRYAG